MDGVPDDNILAKEIESWKGFEYALRQPNANLFNKILTECLENEGLQPLRPKDHGTLQVIVYGLDIRAAENDN
jgi:hypothetical protein